MPSTKVVAGRLDRGGHIRGQLASQLARIDLHEAFPALYRQAHARAFFVDEIDLGRGADELGVMARQQQLGGEQGAV